MLFQIRCLYVPYSGSEARSICELRINILYWGINVKYNRHKSLTLQKQYVVTGFVNCFWVTEKNVGLDGNFTLPVAQVSYETPRCIYLKLLFQYSDVQGC